MVGSVLEILTDMSVRCGLSYGQSGMGHAAQEDSLG